MFTRRLRLAAGILQHGVLAIAVTACAPKGVPVKHGPSAPTQSTESVDGWRLVAEGRLDAATDAFRAQRASHPDEALRGLLNLARMRLDAAAVAELQRAVDPAKASPSLLVTAVLAGIAVTPMPVTTHALAAHLEGLDADPRLGSEVQFARAILNLRASGALTRCEQGCDVLHDLPLALIGGIPVVLASINGSPEAVFVVDTGASISVLSPAFAARIGVQPVPDTTLTLGTATGETSTALAHVDVTLGGLKVRNVEIALVELPLADVAGVLSPQSFLSTSVTSFDLRRMRLEVAPSRAAAKDERELPLIISEGKPYVVGAYGVGRDQLFLLDTGANATQVTQSYAAGLSLGESRLSGASSGAAGGSTLTSSIPGPIRAVTGGLPWSVSMLSIVPDHSGPPSLSGVEELGQVGTDFMMGRCLTLDMPRRRLLVSDESVLDPWPVGSKATFRLDGSLLAKPARLEEEVVERGPESVTLIARIVQGDRKRTLRLRQADNWSTRAAFVDSRRIEQAWSEDGTVSSALSVDEALAELRALAVPFSVQPGAFRFEMVRVALDGHERACTRLSLPVDVEGQAATARFLECPSEPWRATAVELISATGTSLWRYWREGLVM